MLHTAAHLQRNLGHLRRTAICPLGYSTSIEALQMGVEDSLKRLENDPHLQTNTINRYKKINENGETVIRFILIGRV